METMGSLNITWSLALRTHLQGMGQPATGCKETLSVSNFCTHCPSSISVVEIKFSPLPACIPHFL